MSSTSTRSLERRRSPRREATRSCGCWRWRRAWARAITPTPAGGWGCRASTRRDGWWAAPEARRVRAGGSVGAGVYQCVRRADAERIGVELPGADRRGFGGCPCWWTARTALIEPGEAVELPLEGTRERDHMVADSGTCRRIRARSPAPSAAAAGCDCAMCSTIRTG